MSATQNRVKQIAEHLRASPSNASRVATKIGVKSPNDVVIVSALRTPITRARRGPFKDTLADELLAAVLKAVLERTKLNPALVDDVVVGNVLPPGGGATAARMAALVAGLPDTTSVMTCNRQCSSGLQAVAQVAAAIQNGTIEIGIGAGVETMTQHYGAGAMGATSEKAQDFPPAADCLMPMGITSENVAREFNVSRTKQDAFAAESHRRAEAAQKAGLFKDEIVPVTVQIEDKEGKTHTITVSQDDGIRPGTTAEKLGKLKPAFSDDGTTTAGNASQVSDGAAAVLLMRRAKAQELGLPVLGKFITSATVGVPPNVMGIGPAFAIPRAAQQAGIRVGDIDVVELNEAFASQAVYSMEYLSLDPARVNPKGGAIALGHPLGCTGARQIATLLPELKRQNKRVGAVSMCIGTGMGMAAIIERE
ncbi:Thiolase, N-terminal domain-containing protein [Thamnocephalis sphaerospora]|uniref:acetyl-CoA C-acyltransferase n=1 Tax=Thamnocephalis sphaerospora TaxID=78915 RepID=A0A4P9XNU8_9FUNG|nr:Thiolase, N-terminal domain-containing protein [Thamnocephalis sphaerospora]|eukprot:RKP07667.1 Thiolase, N-terminal domain-containing protein [Thamnocephalis sphaerospora]